MTKPYVMPKLTWDELNSSISIAITEYTWRRKCKRASHRARNMRIRYRKNQIASMEFYRDKQHILFAYAKSKGLI